MPIDVLRKMAADLLGVDDADISAGTGLYGYMEIVSVAKLVIECESRFGITIADERVPDMRYLGDLNRYIHDKLKAGENQRAPDSEREREQWFYD